MPYRENTILDKLPSGLSYNAVGCEFNVKDSTIHVKEGILKQKHTQDKVIILHFVKCCDQRLKEANPEFIPTGGEAQLSNC